MSLIPRNSFFNELRKAFRVLEEPFLHHSKSVPAPRRHPQSDLFKAFGLGNLDELSGFGGAYIKEAEDGKNYLVEAELPGVKKENLKVEFSDNGEVLHIEGFKGSLPTMESSKTAATGDTAATSTSDEKAVEKTKEDTSIIPDWAKESYSYGSFHETFVSWIVFDYATGSPATVCDAHNAYSFRRQQRFPSPVDVDKVQASYEDGMLRLTIPKTEKDIERKSIQIT